GMLARGRPGAPLGAARGRSRDVTERGGAVAAGQNELAQRRQRRVEAVELRFETLDVDRGDALVGRHCEVRADVEQLVLHALEALTHGRRQIVFGEQHAERARELVDGADRFDAPIAFVDALVSREPRRAVVSGACVDLAEAVTHALDHSARATAFRVAQKKNPAVGTPGQTLLYRSLRFQVCGLAVVHCALRGESFCFFCPARVLFFLFYFLVLLSTFLNLTEPSAVTHRFLLVCALTRPVSGTY